MPKLPFRQEKPLAPLFSPLEQAVLDRIFEGKHPVLAALRKQMENSIVSSRELSGTGFFTHFKVEPRVSPIPSEIKNIQFGDVTAEITGLQHGAGFVLFVKNGYLDVLEGYTYGEDWPKEIKNFTLTCDEPNRKKLIDYLTEK